MASIDGLVSGLNTTQIVSSLMAAERASGNYLVKGKSTSQTMAGIYQALNSTLVALQTAAKAFIPDTITKTSAWSSTTATSSLPSSVSATTAPNALPGSATFVVKSVATAGAAVSSGSVSSLTAAVADGPLVLTRGLTALGLASVSAGPTLASGAHQVVVTQASAGAQLAGSTVGSLATLFGTGAP